MSELPTASLLIVAGFAMLIMGGEFLVRGASAIAARFRIPPLIIGLTVVSFGTSAPELGVTIQATMAGAPDVAVGNVVGSNIFNILLVLGASAVVAPLSVSSQLIRLDVPLMIGTSLLVWVLAADGVIGPLDGALLLLVLCVYLGLCVRSARRESAASSDAIGDPTGSLWAQLAWILCGLAGLGLGARWLVDGSVQIARWFEVTELVIGLTIVAVGTSLPEAVTSIVASLRGERDIAVGNAVGSNLFNLGCVLGVAGLIAGDGVPVSPAAIRFDIPVMVGAAFVCLPIFLSGGVISRREGMVLLGYYVIYMSWELTHATSSSPSEAISWIALGAVVILTVAVLGLNFRQYRQAARAR